MAGNMMYVPDFIAVSYAAMISIDSNAWEQNLTPHFLQHLSAPGATTQAAGWIDHTQSTGQLTVELSVGDDNINEDDDEVGFMEFT